MLKEWAQWYETSSGYSDSTTLWRAIMAPTQAGFGPSIPKGVEPRIACPSFAGQWVTCCQIIVVVRMSPS